MKIKKVEISGFRAFNKVDDATFNFTLPNDVIANFISIYAPNGFGKTSFYDAVEWCITGQIERFHRNASEYDKQAKENRKNNNKPLFLQNSDQKGKLGYVKVFATDQTFNKELTSSKVYDFKQKAHNIYFNDAILSQDLVDTFIKEDKAEERYKKFIDGIPHLKNYNNALQNIIKLIDENAKDIKDLETKKKDKLDTQVKLDFEGDEKVLEEINKAIANLIEKKQEINLIQKETFTEKEYAQLTNKVNAELTGLSIEIDALNLREGNIDIAYSGSKEDENHKGIVVYYNLREKREELKKQKNELDKLLGLIREKARLQVEKANIEKDLNNELDLNKEHLKIKSDFEKYSNTDLLIQKHIDEISKLNYAKETLNLSLQEFLKQEFNYNNELAKLQNELEKAQGRFKDSPFNKVKLDEVSLKMQNLTNESNNLKNTIDTKQKAIDSINIQVQQNNDLSAKLRTDIDLLLNSDFLKGHKSTIEKIIELKEKQKESSQKLLKINETINLQQDFNKGLFDFLSKGLELISKNESKDCPLCSQQYNSYEELSKKITNNKFLTEVLKSSFDDKSSTEQDIRSIDIKIDASLDLITIFLKNFIKPFEAEKLKHSKELKVLNEKLKINLEAINVLEREINTLKLFFDGLESIPFENKLKEEIENIKEKTYKTNTSLKSVEIDKEERIGLISKQDERIVYYTKEIELAKSNVVYRGVIIYFNEILKSNSVDFKILEKEIVKNNTALSSLKLKIEEISETTKKVEALLASNELNESEIENKINLFDKTFLLNQKVIQNFEQFIDSDYKINLKILVKEEADLAFNNLKISEKKKLEDKKDQFLNYKIVEKLKENTYKSLELKKTKLIIEELNHKLEVNNEINKKLDSEKKKVESFLKKTIDTFFYTDLINEIYRKIDPHPDYEKIDFKCDFSDKNPRLQIYTIDKENNYSIPALYFSTAQINILSLSIFLARALKATNPEGEPVRCIFIDDPIQSMDSINILSFIDLFRSIIVNMDRQLIVSTHEENFHLLLQKKIPKDLFKSKFIEFETFGKLKKDIN